jgi:pimeloyl-ACP methyl ester carboxylesterase
MMKNILGTILLMILVCGCGDKVTIEPNENQIFGGQEARVEEIHYRSGNFRLVGELRMPVEGENLPAIILVHGSGHATRSGAVPYYPLIEIFLRNGYAVFSWDKPGSGESTGDFDGGHTITDRADILVDGIEVLVDHANIDSTRIGLWGISQAGWVMPLALERTNHVAFMISVSGGAEDSIEQMAYQVGQQVACKGGSSEQAADVERYWAQMNKAVSYEDYRIAIETLVDIPQVQSTYNLKINEEGNWKPWPRDIDAFFDPMEVIKHTTIPMLIFFGELDKNIDPVQGAEAYEAALQSAGNQDYQVETLQAVGHVLTSAKTGCLTEAGGTAYAPQYFEILETWLQHLSE